MLLELSALENYMRVQMDLIYYTAMMDEWMGTNVQPLKDKLMKLKQTAENQIKLNSRM